MHWPQDPCVLGELMVFDDGSMTADKAQSSAMSPLVRKPPGIGLLNLQLWV